MARPHPCRPKTHQLSATQGAPHPFSQNCHPDSPSGEYKTSLPPGEVRFCLKIFENDFAELNFFYFNVPV